MSQEKAVVLCVLVLGSTLAGCFEDEMQEPPSSPPPAETTPRETTPTGTMNGTAPTTSSPSTGHRFEENGTLPPAFQRAYTIPVNETDQKLRAVLTLYNATPPVPNSRRLDGKLVDPSGNTAGTGTVSGAPVAAAFVLEFVNPSPGVWRLYLNGTVPSPDAPVAPQRWNALLTVS